MDFLEAISMLGFSPAEERPRRGMRMFAARPNRFMTYWLHLYDDGSALLTWEFAVADYLQERGIQLGSSETLNMFMFPVQDERGPQEAGWLTQALDRVEAVLKTIDFAAPDG